MVAVMLGFLRKLWPRRQLEHLHIILYTRQGCHLCEDTWRLLKKEQARYRFLLETVNIDSEPSLASRFGDQVPVVSVNGQVRFRGTINPILLTRLLRAESRRA